MHKRQLTVELWSKGMEDNRKFQKEIGNKKFFDIHESLGHNFIDVEYEMQMAESWVQHGMQVYDFDRDFVQSILDAKWIDLLPDCIDYRPHDYFYLKLSCSQYSEGVVIGIVPTKNLLLFDHHRFKPEALEQKGVYISNNWPGERAIVNTGKEIFAILYYAISKTTELMLDDTEIPVYPLDLVLNGVAYVCSTNADIVPSYKPQKGLKPNKAKKRSQAIWYDVGYRIGAELRSYNRTKKDKQPHMGGTVRPHMRRAHWHHYWIGPKAGPRKLILKWIPPTMVAIKNEEINSATGHKVKHQSK